MKDSENLTGTLLIAIPNTAHTAFSRGILLVTAHWPAGSAMVMINQPIRNGFTVGGLMRNSGIDFNCNDPIFQGGPDETGRVQFIHSMDWQCPSTKMLNSEIGITGELSVLTAVSAGEGPEYYRCVAGHRLMGPGNIEGEILGQTPWLPEHRWLSIPATADNVFRAIGDEQWLNAIDQASKLEVAHWFD